MQNRPIILIIGAFLALQGCTTTPKKPMTVAEISKSNLGKCTSCHGANYDVNALRISKKLVKDMTKKEIIASLTALQKEDILKDSLKFQTLKVHQLTPADIQVAANSIKK